MNTATYISCRLCGSPIPKNMEVFLNKEPFHPGCAVEAAKEKKHGRKANDARRSQ